MTKDKNNEKLMYDKARGNLLLMIVLTLLNITLFFIGSETFMLFSATVPYMAIVIGYISGISTLMQICIAFTLIVMLAYLLCWIFSKRSPVWMIIAMVMFIIDTVALISIYVDAQEVGGIIDLVIHIWVLYYLFIGVKYGYKLKKTKTDDQADEIINTTAAPYRADMDTKYRVLAEMDVDGYHICYRRVKKTNELVINGYVYDSVEMLIEPKHKLATLLDGREFEVGYDGFRSYIRVDGKTVLKKVRLW